VARQGKRDAKKLDWKIRRSRNYFKIGDEEVKVFTTRPDTLLDAHILYLLQRMN
jgi:hypothetical protein